MSTRASSRSLGSCFCNVVIIAVAVVLIVSLSYPVSIAADEGLSDRQLLQQANFSDIWQIFPSQDDYLKGVKNPCWSRRSKGIDDDNTNDRERASARATDSHEGDNGNLEEGEEEILCLVSR